MPSLPIILAFIAESSSRTALSVTAIMMGDCLPMPQAAYVPASVILFNSSSGTASGLYFFMLLRVIRSSIVAFI